MDKMTIYVAIPCIEDQELEYTISDLLNNSDSPDDVAIGVACMTSLEFYSDIVQKFKNNKNVFINHYDPILNKGVGKGRKNAFLMYSGQDYILQIDSHTLLKSGWDTWMVKLHKEAVIETGTDKTILTSYLPSYTNDGNSRYLEHDNLSYPAFYNEKLPQYMFPAWFETQIRHFPKDRQRHEKFLPCVKFNAHFAFGNKEFALYNGLEDFLFYEEEILQSINLVDKGFALVFPNVTAMLGHMYADSQTTVTKRKNMIDYSTEKAIDYIKQTNENYFNFIDNPLNKEKCDKYQKYANMHLKTGPRKLYYIPERYFP
jgi:hypothetical protein